MHVTTESTDLGMVVPSPLGWTPIPTRQRQPWRWGFGVVAVLIAAFLILRIITVPYYGILPGEALPVDGPNGAIRLGSVHGGSGDLFLATVELESPISEWDRLTDFLHPNDDIIPEEDVTGGATASQYNQENAEAMADSQEDAKVAALRRLGYKVPELGDGAAIIAVGTGTPAAGVLNAGDVITAIDGKVVTIASEVTTDIGVLNPGQIVHITVKRPIPTGFKTISFALQLVACDQLCPGDAGRPLVGIEVTTDRQSFGLPAGINLSIATNGIGGPSAGLAFTLGTIETLLGHDITGGHLVAATGTIDPEGTVGDVGGVKQKTIAVEAQHCQYFIVPRVEYHDAESKAHDLTIIPVDNLDQALTFLASINGDLQGVPSVPPPEPAE